jgi:hypothetical protein
MPRFFLIGDSHSGTIMRAAKAMGADCCGGSIMAGKYMNDRFCKVENGVFSIFVEMGQERLNKRLADAGLPDNLLDIDLPILSTIGFNTRPFVAYFMRDGFSIAGSGEGRFLSAACFRAAVLGSRRGALEFYRLLRAAGKTVHAALSPQRFAKEEVAVARAFDRVMIEAMAAMGVGIVDTRAATTDEDGVLRPKFASTDPDDRVHGNNRFGKLVIESFNAALST